MRNDPTPTNAAEPERRFIYLLSVANRRVQNWPRHGDKGEVSSAQAGVLFLLGEAEGVLMGDVARALGLGPSGATGLIDRMEQARLVERRADERDGRAARLFLTDQGRALRTEAKLRAAAINAELTDGFSDSELDIVARWLTTVRDRFNKDTTS